MITLRSLRRGTLAAFVCAGTLTGPADAATVRVEQGTLVFTAGAGIANYPSFSSPADGTLRISDSGEQFASGAGCTALDPEYPTDLDCPMPTRLRVELGDGNDRIMLRESLPPIGVEVFGQAGDDPLAADHEVDHRIVLDGGEGNDTLTAYGFADTLLGGAGNDILRGGAGNDVLRGGDGDDALEPDGAPDVLGDDVVDGGPGFDSVRDWGTTSTDPAFAVSVTVGGGADDGRPGEHDDVSAIERFDALTPGRYALTDAADSIDLPNWGTSAVEGRTGDDTLTGNDGSETIDGGAGADRIEGGYGHDTLVGGPGADVIFGDETAQRCSYLSDCAVVPFGNDTIDARDGQADTIDCGVGEDKVRVDTVDTYTNCEQIEREPSAVAPPAPRLIVRKSTLRVALRRGLPVEVSGIAAGRSTFQARHRGRVVATATVVVGASGRATARLKFTSAAKRSLTKRRSVVLAVSAGSVRGSVTLR